MIDLHTHSSASDGTLSPIELIELAERKKISAIALTDHDTVAGLSRAREKANELGIRFINGVEIEIAFYPGEFHLLGLDFDAPSVEFLQALSELEKNRSNRNDAIILKLQEAGYDITMDEVRTVAGDSMVGRPHIAQTMIEKKIVKNREQAFDRFLGKGRPFYISKASMQLEDAIRFIHAANGLAIVAHPMSLYLSWGKLYETLEAWKPLGLDGIEAWHPTTRVSHCERLEKMGTGFGYKITAGSDYHGKSRPERTLGRTSGDTKIDERYLLALER